MMFINTEKQLRTSATEVEKLERETNRVLDHLITLERGLFLDYRSTDGEFSEFDSGMVKRVIDQIRSAYLELRGVSAVLQQCRDQMNNDLADL